MRIHQVCAAAALVLSSGGCPSDDTSSDASTAADTDDGTESADAGPTGTDDGADGPDSTESPDSTASTDGPPLDEPPEPGMDLSLSAFEGRHFYWTSDSDDHRRAEVEVEFPPADAGYASVTLDLTLSCPAGGCDYWDRYGSLAVIDNAGTEQARTIEIARFVTPYRVGASLSFDLSHLRPLLTGTQTLELVVDTWVGPGGTQGEGWVVDAGFEFIGGTPSPRPIAVLPLYTRRTFEMGNPDVPFTEAVPARSLTIPDLATSVSVVSIITGHGEGNAENCGEFCLKNHGYLVGGMLPLQRTAWRDDCEDTPVADQVGAWSLDRAGWCPGSEVRPWIEDVTSAAVAGSPLSFEYAISSYENTCRPGLSECMDCALFTSCEYGTNHTMPYTRLSTLLVAYID